MHGRVLCACAALALWASTTAPDGREVTRSFTSELELATESFELIGSDQRMPLHVREQADEVDVVDRSPDAEDPLARFTRTYRTVASSARIGGPGRERAPRTTNAELEGRQVLFERDEDGGWARSTEDDAVRPVQLRRLRADLSLDVFLPPDEVGPGEEHELDVAVLARLVSPLVERHRRPRLEDEAPRGGLDLSPAAMTEPLGALLAGAEGTLTVTPRAAGEDDELPRNADLAFRLEAAFDGSAGIMRGGTEAEDEVTVVCTGSGSIAWDPDTGRIVVACDAALELDERFRVTVESQGRTAEVTGVLAASGTLELAAEEEVAD